MPAFAAAVLLYSRIGDDVYYLALSPRSVPLRRAERLEELFWAPTEVCCAAPALRVALGGFVPRRGNVVLQSYVVGVKPFLLDDDALIAREIVRWITPMQEWSSRDAA